MKRTHLHGLIFALSLLATIAVQAEEIPRYSQGGEVFHGGSPALAKAGADTINLMAATDDPTNEPGEPAYDGDFEDQFGNPDWNGWTHRDITAPGGEHWTVSNYNQPDPLNHAAWCGDIDIPSCDGGATDPDGGYGNNWNDALGFRLAVPDPVSGSTVTVTATLIHDTEPGYDYGYLSYRHQGQSYGNIHVWDGAGTVAVNGSVSYLASEYLDGTDIAVYFRFTSDAGWSDEDCAFTSAGALQIDDINVHLVNGAFTEDHFEDFEHGGDPDDLGIWEPSIPVGVGDFAQIWTGLEDLDPCATNYSPQVAFIDDGLVVPGTGGSQCINWCYGPGGYIVTTTGGLLGHSAKIHNAIESPVMAWPAAKAPGAPDPDGIAMQFSVFRHEDLTSDSPGIFFTWSVRSADTDNSAGNGAQVITDMGWNDRNFVYYGSPLYLRMDNDVTDLMMPGRDEIQVQLAIYQLGWVWNWDGNDGYPAPYFDNVTVKVFPYIGPGMSAREIDLAQDNFPESGTIDYVNLGANHVRFDMAKNISLASHLRNDPGDSLVFRILPVRAGADMDGDPELHYFLDPNPLFDPYRTAGLPIRGSVTGRPTLGPSMVPVPGGWGFDLPDTGFLYPGDVLHYYISATDAIGGVGGPDPRTSLLPADTTGFSTDFLDPQGYDPLFTMRALPTVSGNKDVYVDFKILFINDGANGESDDKWFSALDHYNLQVGYDYDIFHVNGPSSGVGNGIGGRATPAVLSEYTDILYSSGELGALTIANGDFDMDPGDDVGTLTAWLDQGEKDIFLAGDGLAGDLDNSGFATTNFLNLYMGVTFVTPDVRPFISNQAAPRVQAVTAANPWDQVFQNPTSWNAFGGCPGVNRFDGVQVTGSAIRSAEFLDPAGNPDSYPYAAATLNKVGTSRIISMPLDLDFVYTDPNTGGLPGLGHIEFLEDVLYFMGIPWIVGVPPQALPEIVFKASNHPNPFNPGTTVTYSLPRAGHLKLSVYNVRGHLIKTLVDGPRPAGTGQKVFWDGTDNLGSAAASGVYFYEARAAGDVKIGKMTLLK